MNWAMDENGRRIAADERADPSSYFLPIVPDVTNDLLPVPDWPKGAYDPRNLESMLRNRLNSAVEKLVYDNSGQGPVPWLLGVLAVPKVVDFIVGRITDSFENELVESGLVSRSS